MENIVEIKSDVMVNWLYQQQSEMMFSLGGKDEGVVLKKYRDSYTCCPTELRDERGGLFDAVRRLNVRVSILKPSRVWCCGLTFLDRWQ